MPLLQWQRVVGEWQCNTTVRGDALYVYSRAQKAAGLAATFSSFNVSKKIELPSRIERFHIKLEFLASENQGVDNQN